MKTMFATSSRMDSERHGQYAISRWFEHHQKFLSKWGIQAVCSFNNGDENLPIEDIFCVCPTGPVSIFLPPLPDAINVFYHSPCVPRLSIWTYPGLWRSWFTMVKVAKANRFDRIVYIETDFFLLSNRLAEWVSERTVGMSGLWTKKYGMAEAALIVLCEDVFDKFLHCADGIDLDHVMKNEHTAEFLFPWTYLEKGFVGDRWGEVGEASICLDADYVAQVDLNSRIVKTETGYDLVKTFNKSKPQFEWAPNE